MFASAFARLAGPSARSVSLAVAVALVCGILTSLPASQVDAAEGLRGPLGVEARSGVLAAETFVDEKLGLDENEDAGQSLWAPSSPRAISYDGGSSAEPDEQGWYDQGWYDQGGDASASSYTYQEEATYDASSYDTWEEEVCEQESQDVWYTGLASAYSPECNGGTATASGIELDWSTPTVASPWLPLGSYIEIYYEGMTVVAQVTDCGPYVGGRDLDLAPGVYTAFGVGSTEEWGVRTVSYRLL